MKIIKTILKIRQFKYNLNQLCKHETKTIKSWDCNNYKVYQQ